MNKFENDIFALTFAKEYDRVEYRRNLLGRMGGYAREEGNQGVVLLNELDKIFPEEISKIVKSVEDQQQAKERDFLAIAPIYLEEEFRVNEDRENPSKAATVEIFDSAINTLTKMGYQKRSLARQIVWAFGSQVSGRK